ncbi:hypothetical protein BCY84_12148 [Trypanosoma cruzi cruzi]|uniref:Uncharacterized protein n=1 Tax=Trypanosoma cruzi TaxID=5693 RepID=A0A2V2VEV2_TRYCR|nr:hypothetical protein BCY84_12148 [Trypanosoma cruzi cruzi]PWU94939.1 hypothetical protein C4B63_24g241 [Trypanosoma cruzi]
MFTFAWGLYNSLFSDRTYKVLIIGLESSGKTTLQEQMKCIYATNSNNASQTGSGGGNSIPTPAPMSVMKSKRIRPTVGLNMDRITHRNIPPRIYVSCSRGSFSLEKDGDAYHSGSIHSASSSMSHGSFTPVTTRLTLWDVGGSMQTLWANYFAPCHGVIFVVDSTIGASEDAMSFNATGNASTSVVAGVAFSDQAATPSVQSHMSSLDVERLSSNFSPCRMVTSIVDAPFIESEKNDVVTFRMMEEKRRSSQRKAYARNAAVLRAVFSHPHLTDAPLLILSNKADVMGHCPLAEMQEALGLVDLALMHESYENGATDVESHCELNAGGAGEVFGSTSISDHSSNGVDAVGTSGIGKKIMRLAEVSALDGSGVREAMDWLVFQMRDSARVAVEDDGG